MYFYIDESGHTGKNLFDPNQPILYYGVVSSLLDVDLTAEDRVNALRIETKCQRLHASKLGSKCIEKIVDGINDIQSSLDLRFDIYKVVKKDHAIISFFDQVFDSGINPASTQMGYWTPLRYTILINLAALFNDDLIQKAWMARIELNNEKSNVSLTDVCFQLMEKTNLLSDKVIKKLIFDSLDSAKFALRCQV
jgi:hypothetical protein